MVFRTVAGWPKPIRIADPKAIARAMAARGSLVPGEEKHIARNVRIPGLGLRRVIHVLPAAFDENRWEHREQWEQRGNPPSSDVPTAETEEGTVGTDDGINSVCSQCSHQGPDSGNSESPDEINDVPTVPTVPTSSDATQGAKNNSSGDGATDPALTCEHCGEAFLRRPGPGRQARYCSPQCRRAALAARTKGFDSDDGADDVVFDG